MQKSVLFAKNILGEGASENLLQNFAQSNVKVNSKRENGVLVDLKQVKISPAKYAQKFIMFPVATLNLENIVAEVVMRRLYRFALGKKNIGIGRAELRQKMFRKEREKNIKIGAIKYFGGINTGANTVSRLVEKSKHTIFDHGRSFQKIGLKLKMV